MRNLDNEPIDITVAGSPADPRGAMANVPGVRIHYGPALHPDDLAVVDGIPVTSIARTLVDLAEILPRDELRRSSRMRARGGCWTWLPWRRHTLASSGVPRCGCCAK
jgi:hypothetical protein